MVSRKWIYIQVRKWNIMLKIHNTFKSLNNRNAHLLIEVKNSGKFFSMYDL